MDQAVRAGLVLDETALNYAAANPATGGDPATLNLPSLADRNCAGGCTFTRTFRNVDGRTQIWAASLAGLRGRVQPSLARVPANGSVTFVVPSTAATCRTTAAGASATCAWRPVA